MPDVDTMQEFTEELDALYDEIADAWRVLARYGIVVPSGRPGDFTLAQAIEALARDMGADDDYRDLPLFAAAE